MKEKAKILDKKTKELKENQTNSKCQAPISLPKLDFLTLLDNVHNILHLPILHNWFVI